jgi:hypothetical protein
MSRLLGKRLHMIGGVVVGLASILLIFCSPASDAGHTAAELLIVTGHGLLIITDVISSLGDSRA